MFGLSFDIGTTTCVCTLVDLRSGSTVAVASTLNRQAPFGADVIARMARAMQDDDDIGEPAGRRARHRERAASRRCGRRPDVAPEEIYEAVVVGNATMLHLLCGVHPESIALAPYVATFTEPQDLRADELGFSIHPLGWVALFPSIGAYVGADIVGDIVATGLVRDPEVRLLVDVGTNGEIACGSRERTVATAAPAGPAFEGGEIRLRDARRRRRHRGRHAHGRRGGAAGHRGRRVEPRGLCGSGLIDVVAQLRLVGLLNDGGKMSSREEAEAAGNPLADRLVLRERGEGVRAAGRGVAHADRTCARCSSRRAPSPPGSRPR